jgi:hypothetical protein
MVETLEAKMRLPKTVRINNIPFRVVKNEKSFGSSFSYRKALISIGSKGSPREILESFLHEVAEISMVERGMRAAKCKPQIKVDEYVFHGSHKDFTDVIADVGGIVGDMMKLK